MADCDYLYKVILIGDINVGKTSIVRRFRDGAFDDTYRATIGVDFAIRTLDIDNKQVKLQIWDTSGQERFRSITTSYFRNAHGIVLVYDITNRTSLEVAERWLMDVKRLCGDSPINLLVGNKSDLTDRRQVTIQEAQTFAENHGMTGPIETSAKSAANIDQAFYSLAQTLVSLGQGTEPKAFLTGSNVQLMAKREALSKETLGRRKLIRKKRNDKIPNKVASYDHAMGAEGTRSVQWGIFPPNV